MCPCSLCVSRDTCLGGKSRVINKSRSGPDPAPSRPKVSTDGDWDLYRNNERLGTERGDVLLQSIFYYVGFTDNVLDYVPSTSDLSQILLLLRVSGRGEGPEVGLSSYSILRTTGGPLSSQVTRIVQSE